MILRFPVRTTILCAAFLLLSVPILAAPPPAERCFECHETVGELHRMGRHASLACDACHGSWEAHLERQDPQTRPTTDLSWKPCAGCHPLQYRSFLKTATHRPARDEKSQLTGRSPNPFWDTLMMGHGFTKEHATTRSHPLMLTDQLLVDRSFGGRFTPREGWLYLNAPSEKTTREMVLDRDPATTEQKIFIPQAAAAANPVCLQCKTQDQILGWSHLGDPKAAGTTWSRTSPVVALARSVEHGLNCIFCHDPHAARPRIVRDALIEALSRPDGDTVWHRDAKHTTLRVLEMGERGFTRKIALLDRADSRLLCAQCHVEYACNPGTDPRDGKPVTMDDPRTNQIPFKDVFSVYSHYAEQNGFMDFRHALTGGLLWKAQHPEAESFYASRMGTAGVGCVDCHTPRMTDSETGKAYTSHFALTPRLQARETCLRCHTTWSENQAAYAIDSIKAYTRGKLRKAEYWLTSLVEAIAAARQAGIDPATLAKAQEQHLRAHILWEWWTAENSDGFHNPAMARESLARSMDESQKGIKLLQEWTAANRR